MAVISGGIARAVMRAAMPSLIRDGLSGIASISFFKSWGYGINRQDFYGIFRDVTKQVKQEDIVKALDKFKPMPKTAFEKTDLNLSKQYLYDVEFNVYDDRGDYVGYKTFSYSSDTQLEPAEVEEIMTFVVNEGKSPETEGLSFTDAELTGALTR